MELGKHFPASFVDNLHVGGHIRRALWAAQTKKASLKLQSNLTRDKGKRQKIG